MSPRQELIAHWLPHMSTTGIRRILSFANSYNARLIRESFSLGLGDGCLATHAALTHHRTVSLWAQIWEKFPELRTTSTPQTIAAVFWLNLTGQSWGEGNDVIAAWDCDSEFRYTVIDELRVDLLAREAADTDAFERLPENTAPAFTLSGHEQLSLIDEIQERFGTKSHEALARYLRAEGFDKKKSRWCVDHETQPKVNVAGEVSSVAATVIPQVCVTGSLESAGWQCGSHVRNEEFPIGKVSS